MDMLSGWPFYRLQGGWNDAGYGCYGSGSYSSGGPSLYDSDPFFSEASHLPEQLFPPKRTPRTHVKSPNSVAATPPVAMEKHVDTSKKPVDTMASTVASSVNSICQ